jgi:hypothetical protein
MKLSMHIYSYMLCIVMVGLYAVHSKSDDIVVRISLGSDNSIQYERLGDSLWRFPNELLARNDVYAAKLVNSILVDQGKTVFQFNNSIANDLTAAINSLQDSDIEGLKRYLVRMKLIKSSTGLVTIQGLLKNAIVEFQRSVNEIVFGVNGFSPEAKVVKRELDIWTNLLDVVVQHYSAQDKEIIAKIKAFLKLHNVVSSFPRIKLSDNYSDAARWERAIYRAIEKLGKTLGFYCTPLDSWGGWLSQYKMPLFIATGIGMTGLLTFYMNNQKAIARSPGSVPLNQ